MPNPAPTAASIFASYQILLDAVMEGAMALTRPVAADMTAALDGSPGAMTLDKVARSFAVLSRIVRRSIVVSRYIDTLPVPPEQRDGQLVRTFDRVFKVFADHKVDLATYDARIDAELDGDFEELEELEEFDEDDDEALEPDPDSDVPGRPPAALVGELCRDLGLAVQGMPAEWLAPLPAELRLLCARAAAASIRPMLKPERTGRRR